MKKLLLAALFLFVLVGCSDKKPPEITLKSNIDTIEVGKEWVDEGCVATDNKDDTVTCTVKSSNVDINHIGEYQVFYQATDSSDNTKIFIRKVTVIDETKPTLVLNAGVDTIQLGENWIDAGVTVTDNYDDEVNYTVSGSVNNNIPDEYIITYTATDSSGNPATIIRYVNVLE